MSRNKAVQNHSLSNRLVKFTESSITQPRIVWFCWNLVWWCTMELVNKVKNDWWDGQPQVAMHC